MEQQWIAKDISKRQRRAIKHWRRLVARVLTRHSLRQEHKAAAAARHRHEFGAPCADPTSGAAVRKCACGMTLAVETVV